jgi:hypothetical protein
MADEPTEARVRLRLLKVLRDDLRQQQSMETTNRRRQEVWHAMGADAANRGDPDLALLCWQCETELADHDGVSEETYAALFDALLARRLDDDQPDD